MLVTMDLPETKNKELHLWTDLALKLARWIYPKLRKKLHVLIVF